MQHSYGLDAALNRSEKDLRYPISVALPLDDLANEFAHSPNYRRKIAELGERGYTHRRRVRGDGNCFYRSVGFAWLEALVARAASRDGSASTVEEEAALAAMLGGWPEASLFGDLAYEYMELLGMLRQLLGRGPAEALHIGSLLFEQLLMNLRFDLCVVLLVRLVVAAFLVNSAVDSDLCQTVVAQYGSVDAFVSSEVLPLGQEAEGTMIYLAAQELGTRMRIVQLDGKPGPLTDYQYPSEEYVSPLGVHICLLLRTGHYELLYHADMLKFKEAVELRGRCSYCHEPGSLPSDGLLACFHRMCTACASLASRSHNCADRCLLCTGAPIPRRPGSAPAGTRSVSSSAVVGTTILRDLGRRPLLPQDKVSCGDVPRSTEPWVPSACSANTLSSQLGCASVAGQAAARCRADGCDFFGSAETEGWCSRCFRESRHDAGGAGLGRRRSPVGGDGECRGGREATPPPPAAQHTALPGHLGCTCGYTCGTRVALQRHLAVVSSRAQAARSSPPRSPPARLRLSSGEGAQEKPPRAALVAPLAPPSPARAPAGEAPAESGEIPGGAAAAAAAAATATLAPPCPSGHTADAWGSPDGGRRLLSSRLQSRYAKDVAAAAAAVALDSCGVAGRLPADARASCLGCSCGYTCGTSRALERHLRRFPSGDPAHQPGLMDDTRDSPTEHGALALSAGAGGTTSFLLATWDATAATGGTPYLPPAPRRGALSPYTTRPSTAVAAGVWAGGVVCRSSC